MIYLRNIIKTKDDYLNLFEQIEDLKHFFEYMSSRFNHIEKDDILNDDYMEHLFEQYESDYVNSDEYVVYEYSKKEKKLIKDPCLEKYKDFYFSQN